MKSKRIIIFGNTNDVHFLPSGEKVDLEYLLHHKLINQGYRRIVISNAEKMIQFTTTYGYEISQKLHGSKYFNTTKDKMVPPTYPHKDDEYWMPVNKRQYHYSFTFKGYFKQLEALFENEDEKTVLIIRNAEDIFSNPKLAPLTHEFMKFINQPSHREHYFLFVFENMGLAQLYAMVHTKPTLNANFKDWLAEPDFHLQNIDSPSIGEIASMLNSISRITPQHAQEWAVDVGLWMRHHQQDIKGTIAFLQAERKAGKRWNKDYFQTLRRFDALDRIQGDLDQLIGMTAVKSTIESLIHRTEQTRIFLQKQIPIEYISRIDFVHQTDYKKTYNLHFAIVGNPGTGKTTAAKLLGKALYYLGLLPTDSFVKITRNDLVDKYLGATTEKTSLFIDTNLGGCVFLDEAYSLFDEDNSALNYGNEAIDALVEKMSDYEGRFSLIIGGYKKEILTMLDKANPGFKRRFKEIIEIEDYKPDELYRILLLKLQGLSAQLDTQVIPAIQDIISYLYDSRSANFGNGGEMAKLAEELVDGWHTYMAAHPQLMASDPLMTITIDMLSDKWLQVLERRSSKKDPRRIMRELDQLIGLDSVKNKIKRLIATRIMDPKKRIPGHYAFVGNPGTGKTTVARLIGKMFVEMGLLAKGHLIESTANDFIAGYVGQTRPKTLAILEKSLDGVLFIDEAYSLASGHGSSFNHEAVDEIIKYMEDHRDRLCIILAGYTNEMNRLFDSNSGFRSRISDIIEFPNYSTSELMQILDYQLIKEQLIVTNDARIRIEVLFNEATTQYASTFDNARFVRRSLEHWNENKNYRLMMTYGAAENVPPDLLNIIHVDDVTSL